MEGERPLIVGGQVQGRRVCVKEEGCCTTGLVKWYKRGECLVVIEDSGRLRIVQK